METNMECFVIENGLEREADLEDLFPIFGKNRHYLQYILRKARSEGINLLDVIAFLDDEMKEMVYNNVSSWFGSSLRKQISEVENKGKEYYTQYSKKELIKLVGNNLIMIEYPENIIWKKAETKEEKAAKPPMSPFEAIEECINEMTDSGHLGLTYFSDKITFRKIEVTYDDIQKVFKDNQNKIQEIRSLSIDREYLPAAAMLFETGKIEKLTISGKEEDEWPSFLEKCHALTELTLQHTGSEFPSWIRNAVSLRKLSIINSEIASFPDWIDNFQSLTELYVFRNVNLTTLPNSIGNLKNLQKITFEITPIEEIPDSIGNLVNLVEIIVRGFRYGKNNKSLIKKLPESIGNLKNLQKITIEQSHIQKIPDSIGNLQSLTELSLFDSKYLEILPDSIGNLKNLTKLNISNSPIERLPDSIVNCTALEYVNIRGTKITSVPDFFSSLKYFEDNKNIEVIPSGHSISYRCFCNSYYQLVKTLLRLGKKARCEGLLELEDDLDFFADDYFKLGMRLVVDGTDAKVIHQILTARIEREHDFYRKKLMEVAIEGILCIQKGDNIIFMVNLLASLVNIENNPVVTFCTKYIAGDTDAFFNIDFDAVIVAEDEREEIRFIKRAIELSEIMRREGIFATEEHLDHEGIARRDVFEYGLLFVIDGWKEKDLENILDNLVEFETDPVQRKFAQAKKEAVLSIAEEVNTRILLEKICPYFDEEIEKEIRKTYQDD